MIEDHPFFERPTDLDCKIWRYLDIVKFLDLLNTSTLYFARADQFNDLHEGAITRVSREHRDSLMTNLIDKKEVLPHYAPEYWEKKGVRAKKEFLINCWHLNNYESAAMWQLYGKSNSGIAIQTTCKRLIDVLNKSRAAMYLGMVKYIDYDNDTIDWGNVISPFIHKRMSFAHESEIRAIIWVKEEANIGFKIKVDIKELIENVYVSPESPKWLTELITNTCIKFGYHFNVINSRLNETPLF